MNLDEKSESLLISRVLSGDKQAFEILYQKHFRPVYSIAYRICQSKTDAEEVVSETFLKSYRQLSQFQGRSSYAAWLYRIAVNESRTLLRRRRNDLPWDEAIEAFSASSQSLSLEEEVVKTQETNILKAAMLRLSPEDRLILSLRYDQELSYEEISEITQIPKNTVGTRIYRSKKQLMVWLKEGEMENAHRVSN